MTTIKYQYCVVRYVHDPSADERLNVGVLLYAPSIHSLEFQFEPHSARLSNTFCKFDGDQFERYIGQLETLLGKRKLQIASKSLPNALPLDLEEIIRRVWPDGGSNFQPGTIYGGITSDVKLETNLLFERMVSSQFEKTPQERRDDGAVWDYYKKSMSEEVRSALKPKRFETSNLDVTFQRTYKNGKYRIVEPVSLDCQTPYSFQERALSLLGVGTALKDNPEISKIYLLLGKPLDKENMPSYYKAKDLLHKMPLDNQIIEEDEAIDFANSLDAKLKEARQPVAA